VQIVDLTMEGTAMPPDSDEPSIRLNGFVFDIRHAELSDPSGARVSLRPQVLTVLQCLARNADRLVSKEELMLAVWPGVVVTDDSLVQCIKELRHVFGATGRHVIETEPKRGYRLVTGENSPPVRPHLPFVQEIRFANSADGTRIAYATSGEGIAIVRAAHWMTHLEWDWQSAVYGPWIQGVSRRYRLVRYDGRGCGLSDRGVPMGTLDDEVNDLEAVVDAAGLERFALLGRSQGGPISIRYAARHPVRVSHLILVGAFARGGLKRGVDSIGFDQLTATTELLQAGWGRDNAAFRQLITSMIFPGASAEQVASFNHLQQVAATPEDAATLHRMIAEYDASADLAQVRCPTLVMHSARDNVAPFEEGRLIAATIPGACFEPFESLNHTPLPGEPAFDQLRRRIDEFVGGAAVRPRPERTLSRPALHG
jgi:pimeloyl-ACP methyl ester carboxylesterase/DNA-binding winged helix-turn-helix (wHTH) protein